MPIDPAKTLLATGAAHGNAATRHASALLHKWGAPVESRDIVALPPGRRCVALGRIQANGEPAQAKVLLCAANGVDTAIAWELPTQDELMFDTSFTLRNARITDRRELELKFTERGKKDRQETRVMALPDDFPLN